MLGRRLLFSLIFALTLIVPGAFTPPSAAQTAEAYDGTQLIRGRKGRVVYDINGGEFDGKRGYLFRIANQSDVPLIFNTIPDGFSETVLGFLSVGATFPDGTPSFVGRATPYEELFDGTTETLNVSASTQSEDRPFNFIVVVEPTVEELIWFFRGREKRARAANSELRVIDLGPSGPSMINLNYVIEEWDSLDPSQIQVTLDGAPIASPQSDGTLGLDLAPGQYELTSVFPGRAGSRDVLIVEAGLPLDQTIVLISQNTNVTDYRLAEVGTDQPSISISDTEFRFEIIDEATSARVPIDDLQYMDVVMISRGSSTGSGGETQSEYLPVDDLFMVLTDGTIQATNITELLTRLQSLGTGPYQFEIMATSSVTGLDYRTIIEVAVERFSLNGTIQVSPTGPGFDVQDAVVRLTSIYEDTEFEISPDSSGSFSFGTVPTGDYNFLALVQVGDQFLSAQSTVLVNEDKTVIATPLTLDQIVAGDLDFEEVQTSTFSTNARSTFAGYSDLQRIEAIEMLREAVPTNFDDLSASEMVRGPSVQTMQSVPSTQRLQEGDPDTIAINTFDNKRVQAALEFFVTDMTLNVDVIYQLDAVFLGDLLCPDCGPYSDNWSFYVYDQSGQPILRRGSSFRSSLRPPSFPWLQPIVEFPNFPARSATTGEVLETLNLPVIENPTGAPRRLIIRAVLRNSVVSEADSMFLATLKGGDVTTTEPPEIVVQANGEPQSDAPARGRFAGISGEFVSIPASGVANTFDYRIPVKVDFSNREETVLLSDISNVIVSAQFGRGNEGGTIEIFNGTPPLDQITEVGDGEFELLVSYTDPNGASQVNDDPPPSEYVIYKIEVAVDKEGFTVSNSVNFPERKGLWAYSGNIDTYPEFDVGGDKWASRAVNIWINDNENLIPTRFGDITAEHARPIRNSGSHSRGEEMDTRFFGLGATAGGTVYRNTATLVLNAIEGDTVSEAALTDFVEAQREALEDLYDTNVFRIIIGPIGDPETRTFDDGTPPIELPSGWFRDLYLTGEVLDADDMVRLDIGGSLNLGPGDRYITNSAHNNHYHISFQPARLEDGP